MATRNRQASRKKVTASPIRGVIKELRGRLGLSQEKLADKLGVSLPTVNRWEKGASQPDPRARKNLVEFVHGLGPGYEDLLERLDGATTGDTPEPRPEPSESGPEKPEAAEEGEVLDAKGMEGLLWKAACSIRGEKDAPKFKDYILPLVFIKRLSDVFEDELERLKQTYGDEETTLTVLEADHSLVRFYLPPEATWPVVSGRRKFDWPSGRKPRTLGEQLTHTIRAIAKSNPSLQGVIDIVDYNETRNGEREISDGALHGIIQTLSDPRYRLGLKDVEPDFLGRAYEYLLRKFAEGQGQSAGEFFTPKEVGWLMAYLVQPQQGETVYDPCCGSGGLLIKCQLALKERDENIKRPLRLHGQELTGSSFAIARMNMVVHDMEGEVVRGNTMTNPKFLDGTSLRQFDIVVTNPMWNQDNIPPDTFENDPYGRFDGRGGIAPASTADWAWVQHVYASLDEKQGRAAIVLDTGAVSRGSGSRSESKEKAIRKWFVDNDLVDGVILLPENLFYNTTAAGIILLLNRNKPIERKGRIVLVNASQEFQKGRPKNFLTSEAMKLIAETFHSGTDGKKISKVVTNDEVAQQNDYNLSPSRYITVGTTTEVRDVQEILDDLAKLAKEGTRLDGELKEIFSGLGYKWQRL